MLNRIGMYCYFASGHATMGGWSYNVVMQMWLGAKETSDDLLGGIVG